MTKKHPPIPPTDETDPDGIPILPATSCEGGLKIYCRYCRDWHYHGVPDGHRLAHCVKDTPYKKTGYILRTQTDKPGAENT